MYEPSCVILNGEILGNSVIANRYFLEIYNISATLIKNFISTIDSIDNIAKPVRIKNFDIENGNYINIHFKNKNSIGNVIFSYLLNKNNELTLEGFLLHITSGKEKDFCIYGNELPIKNNTFIDNKNSSSPKGFSKTLERYLKQNMQVKNQENEIIPNEEDIDDTGSSTTVFEKEYSDKNAISNSIKQDNESDVSMDSQTSKDEHITKDDIIELIDEYKDNNPLPKLEVVKVIERKNLELSEDDQQQIENTKDNSGNISTDEIEEHAVLSDLCEEFENKNDKNTTCEKEKSTEYIDNPIANNSTNEINQDNEESLTDEITPEKELQSLNSSDEYLNDSNELELDNENNEVENDLIEAKNEAEEDDLDKILSFEESLLDNDTDVIDFFDTIPRFEANNFESEIITYEIFNDNNYDNLIFKNSNANNSEGNAINSNGLDRETKITMYQNNFVGYDKQMATLKIDKLKQNLKQLQQDKNLTNDDVLDAQIELLFNDKAKAFKILDSNTKNDVLQLDDGLFLSKDKVYYWGDILVLKE